MLPELTLNGAGARLFPCVWPGLAEPYVLMTHLPGPDGFLSVRRLESEIQIPGLSIYKKEENHNTGI